MSLEAIWLFGSLARADQTDDFDVDVLAVTLDDATQHRTTGRLSLFLYPWTTLQSNARNGDLFVCHLVREAKSLFDPDDYLPRLKNEFEYRSDYTAEIDHATDLGWYLVKYGEGMNSPLLAKRVLWCIRTILIARSAERREPVFAPQVLADQTHSTTGGELLRHRHRKRSNSELQRSLLLFLEAETDLGSSSKMTDRRDFITRFRATSNEVALSTLQQRIGVKPQYC